MTAAQATEPHDSNPQPATFGMGGFPFHEAIPFFLRSLRTPEEVRVIGNLLLVTKIPHGHADIMSAWKGVCANVGYEDVKVYDKLQAGIAAASARESKN